MRTLPDERPRRNGAARAAFRQPRGGHRAGRPSLRRSTAVSSRASRSRLRARPPSAPRTTPAAPRGAAAASRPAPPRRPLPRLALSAGTCSPETGSAAGLLTRGASSAATPRPLPGPSPGAAPPPPMRRWPRPPLHCSCRHAAPPLPRPSRQMVRPTQSRLLIGCVPPSFLVGPARRPWHAGKPSFLLGPAPRRQAAPGGGTDCSSHNAPRAALERPGPVRPVPRISLSAGGAPPPRTTTAKAAEARPGAARPGSPGPAASFCGRRGRRMPRVLSAALRARCRRRRALRLRGGGGPAQGASSPSEPRRAAGFAHNAPRAAPPASALTSPEAAPAPPGPPRARPAQPAAASRHPASCGPCAGAAPSRALVSPAASPYRGPFPLVRLQQAQLKSLSPSFLQPHFTY